VLYVVEGRRFLPTAEGLSPQHDELRVVADAVIRGDAVALRTFLTEMVPQLLRVVRRVLGAGHSDLEDITYEAAYATVESLAQFRGEGSVRHFACRIAVLTAMNVRRREATQKRARQREVADPEELRSEAPSPEVNAENAALAPIVRELMLTLSEPLAEALSLHVILGYTVAEIAASSGVGVETVRSRLRLAKQALRKRALGNPSLREALEVEP
jgi:RNA polymerase sigma factor (sigma-70 family)